MRSLASGKIYKIYKISLAKRAGFHKQELPEISQELTEILSYKFSLACEQEHYFLNAKKVQFLKKNFVSFRIVCIFALSNVEVREGAVSAY